MKQDNEVQQQFRNLMEKNNTQKTIIESPLVICQCGSTKWERLYVVKHVPESVSKNQLFEIPILYCTICKRELPTADQLIRIQDNIEPMGDKNESTESNTESKDGSITSTKDD